MSRMNRKQITAGNEVAEIKEFVLGGYPQKVLIEGKKKENPVVIALHGGPGMPIPFAVGCRGMFPVFTDHVTMVYWDQLGCGINNYPITDDFQIAHFVQMTVDLVREVKRMFASNKLILLGVSWGSILAAKAAAQAGDMVNRVITYGQVLCDMTFNEEVYRCLNASKLPVGKKAKLSEFQSRDRHTVEEAVLVMKWIRKYTEGYQCRNGEKAPVGSMIKGLMTSPDYTFKDFKAVIINGYRGNKSLIRELTETDLRNTFTKIKQPYLILQGSTDIVTPTKIVTDFVTGAHQPNISCRIIENCGHMPDMAGMRIILQECIENDKDK